MAELSNQLMAFTVLAYLGAMVCYAAEYAFGKRSHIGRAAVRPAQQLVGAGGPPVTDEMESPIQPAEPRDRGALLGRIAVGFNVLALLLHLGTLVTRGVAADRMPWGNMYEFILSVSFVGSAAWLGILFRRPGIRHLGLFVALTMVSCSARTG
jgi:ABC-type transport system involved in cytochrome c biogenesis permease subunit